MKSEKPTPHRLKKESEKGKSFQSKDLLAFVMLIAGAIALGMATSLSSIADLYRELVNGGFSLGIGAAMKRAMLAFAWAAAPMAVACIVVAVLTSLCMSRGIIATGAIKLDFTKLNPVTGFKNMFSMRIIKDTFKAALYLIACLLYIAWFINDPMRSVFAQVDGNPLILHRTWIDIGMSFLKGLLIAVTPIALAAGFADFWLFIRDMRMEKHEVKQEYKETQGNPEVKRRQREVAHELSAQTKADVAGASVILANPTHIAVGIYVHDDVEAMPFVSLRERGAKALAIIRYAEKIGVPVVRDITVARSVYRSSRRYQFVSDECIEPVMRIIQWLRDVERAASSSDPQ